MWLLLLCILSIEMLLLLKLLYTLSISIYGNAKTGLKTYMGLTTSW